MITNYAHACVHIFVERGGPLGILEVESLRIRSRLRYTCRSEVHMYWTGLGFVSVLSVHAILHLYVE